LCCPRCGARQAAAARRGFRKLTRSTTLLTDYKERPIETIRGISWDTDAQQDEQDFLRIGTGRRPPKGPCGSSPPRSSTGATKIQHQHGATNHGWLRGILLQRWLWRCQSMGLGHVRRWSEFEVPPEWCSGLERLSISQYCSSCCRSVVLLALAELVPSDDDR
jgi:hypothetical protein